MRIAGNPLQFESIAETTIWRIVLCTLVLDGLALILAALPEYSTAVVKAVSSIANLLGQNVAAYAVLFFLLSVSVLIGLSLGRNPGRHFHLRNILVGVGATLALIIFILQYYPLPVFTVGTVLFVVAIAMAKVSSLVSAILNGRRLENDNSEIHRRRKIFFLLGIISARAFAFCITVLILNQGYLGLLHIAGALIAALLFYKFNILSSSPYIVEKR